MSAPRTVRPGTILRAMAPAATRMRGLARGLASAAAVVANAVFDVIGVVGVARPVLVLDIGIILGALIDIVDHERDRRSGRHLRAGRLLDEHAGEDFHRVRLAPLRGEARLARPPLVEIGLDVGLGQRDAGRAAVDHAADRRPMALAEGRDPEKVAEGIERHGVPPAGCGSPRAGRGQIQLTVGPRPRRTAAEDRSRVAGQPLPLEHIDHPCSME